MSSTRFDYSEVYTSQGSSPFALRILIIFILGSLCFSSRATSQSQPLRSVEQRTRLDASAWNDQFALPGPNFDTTALTSTLDAVYVAGAFTFIGNNPVQSLARFDRSTQVWEEIGGGLDLANGAGFIQALTVGDAGELYVAGSFTEPGGQFFPKVAVWDGDSWHVLEGSLGAGSVSDLLFHGGVLYASGAIPDSSGIFRGVVQWAGNDWLPLGNGTSGLASSLAVDSQGRIYAGGAFSPQDTVVYGVGCWDGNSWSFLDSRIEGGIQPGPSVSALSIWDDHIYVAGHFDSVGGTPSRSAASWDGQEWQALDLASSVFLPEIDVLSPEQVYIGSGFTLHAWDGQTWSEPGLSLPFEIQFIEADGNEVFIGGVGVFSDLVPPSSAYLFRYDGSDLSVFHTKDAFGITGYINVLATDDNCVFVGGEFNFAGSFPVQNIACWDGMQWSSLGTGLDDAVLSLTIDDKGLLYAGGRFTQAGSTNVTHVGVWDGTQWQPLGSGVDGPVGTLLAVGDDLYVGGFFNTATDTTGTVVAKNLARWDGVHWHEVGGGVAGNVNDLAMGNDDILYVAGSFEPFGGTIIDNSVQAWDGISWVPIGSNFGGPVWTVAWHDSMLYAGGNFIESLGDPGNGIVLWDGNSWQPLGAGTQGPNPDVEDISFSDRGDLYATGWFSAAGGSSASLVARWDGTQWHPIDGGLYGTYGLAAIIKNDKLYVGGAFVSVGSPLFSGGIPTGNFAEWTIPIDLPSENEGPLPILFELHQNYPNPSSGLTTISYALPHTTNVQLDVFDLLGRRVSMLISAKQNAGYHKVVTELVAPSGVYIVRLWTDYGVRTRKMTILR